MPNRAPELSWEEPPKSRPSLARAEIVQTALKVADRDGLTAVSIRRIAATLGVRPMTLYSRVASKADLIDLMINEVVTEVLIPEPLPADWREALRAIARQAHSAYARHPWIITASGASQRVAPNTVLHAEQLLSALSPLQLTPKDAWAVAALLNDYTLGHAQRLLSESGVPARSYPDLDPAMFPHLARALHAGDHQRDQESFETGLETVIAGITHQYG